ncbi:MAG: GNAT family N-acetyltransferase [Pseudomonadota bacterium]|nr:GNAT family N-acetyltransferase [Pseudomonadota bacterium]
MEEQNAGRWFTADFGTFRQYVLSGDPDMKDTVLLAFPEQGGEPAGLVSFYYRFSFYRTRPILSMRSLFVAPAFRGRKVGQLLVRDVMRRGLDKGCCGMGWDIFPDNEGATRFYDRLGLKPDADRFVHYWADETQMKEFVSGA